MTTPILDSPTVAPDLTDEDTARRLIESVDDTPPCLYFEHTPGDRPCSEHATHNLHSSCGHNLPLCTAHAHDFVAWLHGFTRRACVCTDPRPPHHTPFLTVVVTVVPL